MWQVVLLIVLGFGALQYLMMLPCVGFVDEVDIRGVVCDASGYVLLGVLRVRSHAQTVRHSLTYRKARSKQDTC